jgi:hypothetical protein
MPPRGCHITDAGTDGGSGRCDTGDHRAASAKVDARGQLVDLVAKRRDRLARTPATASFLRGCATWTLIVGLLTVSAPPIIATTPSGPVRVIAIRSIFRSRGSGRARASGAPAPGAITTARPASCALTSNEARD